MHTTFSPDGRDTPAAMCEEALDMGLEAVAFTEHAEWYNGQGGFPNAAAYMDAIRTCRDIYEPWGLRIFSGVELGNPHHFEREARDLLDRYNFDIIVGSVHWVHGKNIHAPSAFYGHDPQMIYWDYFWEVSQLVQRFPIEILAHFDRIFLRGMMIGAYPDLPRLEPMARDAMAAVAESGVQLELNTRMMGKDYYWWDVLVTFLHWYREAGGENVVVNSDAHRAAEMGLHFDWARNVLRQVGFTSTFQARTPVPVRRSTRG